MKIPMLIWKLPLLLMLAVTQAVLNVLNRLTGWKAICQGCFYPMTFNVSL